MISKTFHLEFLTPCFCAGADQTRAELRPSAIRGQLRWWFRAMCGTKEDEAAVFGSVHESMTSGSSVIIRAAASSKGGEDRWWEGIQSQGMDRSAYLLGFFCGRTGRLKSGAALAPGSTGVISLTYSKPIDQRLKASVDLAVDMFFSVGAIGFRTTRAAGAFACMECALTSATWSEKENQLRKCGFRTELSPKPFTSWKQLVGDAGYQLKHRFRSKSEGLGISAGRNGTSPNVLGSADPRQASVLHFRPVKIDGQLRLLLLEAPHQRILGEDTLNHSGYKRQILT